MKASDKMKMAYANMKEGKMTGKKMAAKEPQPTFEKWLASQNITLNNGEWTRQDGKKFSKAELELVYKDNFTNDKHLVFNEDKSTTETDIRAIDGVGVINKTGASTTVGYKGTEKDENGNYKTNETINFRQGSNPGKVEVPKQESGEDALDSPFMGATTKKQMTSAAKNYGSKSPQQKATQKIIKQRNRK